MYCIEENKTEETKSYTIFKNNKYNNHGKSWNYRD